jgi:beta-mannosidase
MATEMLPLETKRYAGDVCIDIAYVGDLEYHVKWALLGPDGKELPGQHCMDNRNLNIGPDRLFRSKVSLFCKLEDSLIWHPHGTGSPHLVPLNLNVRIKETDYEYSIPLKLGIREARLITEDDSIGQSFRFEINGEPVFIKGANYIPQHSFPSIPTDDHFRRLLCDAKESGFNMLRVWGGGIYERDIFYDLCDSLGIMVWKDFMFACNMYPGDSLFLASVAE